MLRQVAVTVRHDDMSYKVTFEWEVRDVIGGDCSFCEAEALQMMLITPLSVQQEYVDLEMEDPLACALIEQVREHVERFLCGQNACSEKWSELFLHDELPAA